MVHTKRIKIFATGLIVLGIISAIMLMTPLDRHNPIVLFFTDLRLALYADPPDPSLYIQSLIINTNPLNPAVCSSERMSFEFFVLLTNGTAFISNSCTRSADTDGYLQEIRDYLSHTHGYPDFRIIDLKKIPRTMRDG